MFSYTRETLSATATNKLRPNPPRVEPDNELIKLELPDVGADCEFVLPPEPEDPPELEDPGWDRLEVESAIQFEPEPKAAW